jgi:hypothetical protein
MTGLLLALIVVAALGLLFWMLEGEDWNRMRHGHLPRPSMGAVGPWMRDVLHWHPDGGERPDREQLRAAPIARREATPPRPQSAPDPPKPPEPTVEASVYDRLYGDRRAVRKQEHDDDDD